MKSKIFLALALSGCANTTDASEWERIGVDSQATFASDLIVRRDYVSEEVSGYWGEGMMIQHQRGGITSLPRTFVPSNEVVLMIESPTGGVLNIEPPPFPLPESPVYRLTIVEPKPQHVTLRDAGNDFARCVAAKVGWLDIQWSQIRWETIAWGGGCGPLALP